MKRSPEGIQRRTSPRKMSPEELPRRTSPRKPLAATMSKVRLQLWRSTSEARLKHCNVCLAKLSEEAIQKANVKMDKDWNKVVRISKEFYLQRRGIASTYQVDRKRARETKPGSPAPGIWRKGKRYSSTSVTRGVDKEKVLKMKPRMLVDEAKRKQLDIGWKKTENSKESHQVITQQITKKVTMIITLTKTTVNKFL